MASAQLFDTCPPFPEDVLTASLPKISLAKLTAGSEEEALKMFQACSTTGFFLLDLKSQPGGESLACDVDKLFGIAQEVVEVSQEVKDKLKLDPASRLIGYDIAQDELLSDEPRRDNPKPVLDNWETYVSFLRNSYPIIQLILGVLDNQLGLPNGTLASLQRQDRPSGTVVRTVSYPPQPVQDRRTSLQSHTDIGSITMLFNILGGLQILPPNTPNEDANWRYVRPEPKCVIINIGDALVAWTGGVLRSNMHRVTFPPGAQAEHARISVAYLVRAEPHVSMRRLVGGRIPSAIEDGEEDSSLSAREWELKRAMALQKGLASAMSKGGRKLKAASVEVH